jgi:hypothetical protein
MRAIGADIGWAIQRLKRRNKVRRVGWNDKRMWLELQVPDLGSKMNLPYAYLNIPKADGTYTLVPWTCSQTDLLATDWEQVP